MGTVTPRGWDTSTECLGLCCQDRNTGQAELEHSRCLSGAWEKAGELCIPPEPQPRAGQAPQGCPGNAGVERGAAPSLDTNLPPSSVVNAPGNILDLHQQDADM